MSLFKKLVLISAFVFAGLATTQANSAESSVQTRIVGGTESVDGEWQWIVALSRSSSTAGDDLFQNQFCGGSLIHESWVLTAAHCVVDAFDNPVSASGVHAFVGAYDLINSTGEYRAVDLVLVHPNYNSTTTDNDIALLRLATPSNVTPVSLIDISVAATLETVVDDDISDFTVIGWGSTSEDQNNPLYPSILREVDLPYVSNDTCNSSALSGQLTDNMICAGVFAGGIDSCQGDSGGPLIFSSGGQLSGIVSWGIGCAQEDSYGVYTRLNNYTTWIGSILNGFIVSPDIQFGSWLSNTTITAILTIQNSSSSTLTLNSFSTTNPAFTVLGNNCGSIVYANTTCDVTVEFASGSLSGTVSDTVSIGTDSASVPVITVPLEVTVVAETFFSNVQADNSVQWGVAGDSNWTEIPEIFGYSLLSGSILDNQSSSLFAYVEVLSDLNQTEVSFDWKVSSEPNYDFLELWVDNSKVSTISGSSGWLNKSIILTGRGSHVIEWRYKKDYSDSAFDDAGWVRNISLQVTTIGTSSSGGAISGWVYLMFGLPLIMRRRFRKH